MSPAEFLTRPVKNAIFGLEQPKKSLTLATDSSRRQGLYFNPNDRSYHSMRNESYHRGTSARRLIEDVMRHLEREGNHSNDCQTLLRASALLRRAELALCADPNQEWPLYPPLKESRWRTHDDVA